MAHSRDAAVETLSGLRFAIKWWEPDVSAADAGLVVAFHGWLDNAASFDALAPALVDSLGVRIAAVDLAGHGLSAWKPLSSFYSTLEHAAHVIELIEELTGGGSTPLRALIGHSMGGGIASVVAATLGPERVGSLILVDNSGLPHRPAKDSPEAFARSVTAKRSITGLMRRGVLGVSPLPDSTHSAEAAAELAALEERDSDDAGGAASAASGAAGSGAGESPSAKPTVPVSDGPGGLYPTLRAAIAQRVANVATFADGKQFISWQAAQALCLRAVVPVFEQLATASVGGDAAAPEAAGGTESPRKLLGWRFRFDRRAVGCHLVSVEESQVLAFLHRIACPVLLLQGDRGWPIPAEVAAGRLEALRRVLTHRVLPGGHHLHLDPKSAPAVAAEAIAWLRGITGGKAGAGEGEGAGGPAAAAAAAGYASAS